MELNSDFNITKLFFSKDVNISADGQNFTIHVKTLNQILTDVEWGRFYVFITQKTGEEGKKTIYDILDINDSYSLVKMIIFDLGAYEQFRKFYDILLYGFEQLFDEYTVDTKTKQLKVEDVSITPEIWDYIIYILRLSYGEEIKAPMQFDSEEARQFFLAQQRYEKRIREIRSQGSSEENLIKVLLVITYAFPSLTIDYLGNQTMAQIHWLQKLASGAVSYEVNAKAFAAGNVKKDSRLEFFIK